MTNRYPFPSYPIGALINDPGNPTEFEITHFGEMAEPAVEDPHTHQFYEILWVDAGACRQEIDYQHFEVGSGSLFFISPGQLHLLAEWQHLQGGTLMFTEAFTALHPPLADTLFELTYLDNGNAGPLLAPPEPQRSKIRQRIALLEEEFAGARDSQLLQALLQVLLVEIQRCVNLQLPQPPAPQDVRLYKQLMRQLQTLHTAHLGVTEYASLLKVTARQLSAACYNLTAKTAIQVIRAYSAQQAQRLLAFTDFTVAEIAYSLGYEDASYFARSFRAAVGSSPTEFRTAAVKKYRK